nr:immunoglobulin heavy chain junction region [Macaca mulatta]MOW87001.1 immunoglobulin heavy chain junction region [Macaca mulatta]MOW87097.1 immunoglobulin heavy chain junction region [Macaca mulatta]MOW88036.1 immunoglobulin heavy chain junction region [Macaca mulatta]MOW88190.1 immunoglobulin heavy chain junction region [Macaca mulatta]
CARDPGYGNPYYFDYW